ncbi:MAG: ribonuclease T [Rhodobacteraceae bacterium CG17_big_fil_post_rev_8_21_14_2_50_63_15]|nr:MAG: ribonuclease T [Rhodobacteraceae bacterium CG17_big_fil_post_rev_8_21_14_2_50_63_15]
MRVFLLFILCLCAVPAAAQSHRSGDFDYYVLSLSWQPTWCALEGDARGDAACQNATDHGWLLHGLWPQYLHGWPEHCQSTHRPPSRQMTQAMADIMGSPGPAWYQWKKHGSCSGLSAPAYFALAREAYARVNRPIVFRKLSTSVKLPAQVVEDAFLKANPDWTPDMLTITCRDGRIAEARLCLSRDLAPVPCGPDLRRDCQMKNSLLAPIR